MNTKRFFYEVVWSRSEPAGLRTFSEIYPRLVDAYMRLESIEANFQPEVWRVEVQRDCRVQPNGRPA